MDSSRNTLTMSTNKMFTEMQIIDSIQDCFDELAIFTCPSNTDEQKQALLEIKSNMRELPLNQVCKKISDEVKEIINQFNENSNPETTYKAIQDKLMNMLDLLAEP